ncbi:hypothetical protein BH10PSE7_BH10PSE7_28120 [soil metagenome]
MEWPKKLRQEHVEGCQVFADRHAMIKSMTARGFAEIAEIGVGFGDFSEILLRELKPKTFHAFDIFQVHQLESMLYKNTAEIFGGLEHRAYYERRFAEEVSSGIVRVHEGDSSVMLSHLPDESLDMIYIDGLHNIDGVRVDAAVSLDKIKPRGMLIFNDYLLTTHLGEHYGVVQIVNELCVDHGWKMTHFALHNAMFCDVALVHGNS